MSAHDQNGRSCPHDDFLHHTAHVPSRQATLAMAAQNDEILPAVAREIDDLFRGIAFQRLSPQGQAGFLPVVCQSSQIAFGFSFPDPPLEGIDPVRAIQPGALLKDAKQDDPRLEGAGHSHSMGQDAFGQSRSI